MKNTFELEHVGINTDNAGEAEQLALLLCKLFNLEPRHGQKSEFAGNYFECMKSPFLGKNGRIKNVYLEGEYGGFAIHIMQK